jgi:subtilisin family serine protease
VTQQCRVVSFSIGGEPDPRYDKTFERIARRVLDAGTLIVAAAGNESRRSRGVIRPVCHPANCPSIMAVAAVDQDLRVADFSNRGSEPEGGQIDIAGPGVDVLSAWPPDGYELSDGTSMATPHVAGIAALYAEARPKMTARDLWSVIVQEARRLEAPSADVGAGLVQAPR